MANSPIKKHSKAIREACEKRTYTTLYHTDVIDFLILELQTKGPERKEWPNYSKLSSNTYHCHLKKGRPTYVACWKVFDSKLKHIEVYYVGTHEGAPY